MPEPLSPKIGFGMKVAVLPAAQAVFLMMYLNFCRSSPALSMRVEPVVDLRLAGGADLVVRPLDVSGPTPRGS